MRIPPTTMSFAATAAWTSFKTSERVFAILSRTAGWICASGRMGRGMGLSLVLLLQPKRRCINSSRVILR